MPDVPQSTKNIPDDVGDCPHWCPACLRERRDREVPTITGAMLAAALEVCQRAKMPIGSTLVLKDAIAAAIKAGRA